MDNNAIVEELNQLLKGTHMGIGIFEDLEGKLQSERLKTEFHGLLDKLNDKQVLEEAVKNMKMAQKALHAFDEKHLVLNDQMKKTMRIMQEDYESMYHMLHKYLIEFQ